MSLFGWVVLQNAKTPNTACTRPLEKRQGQAGGSRRVFKQFAWLGVSSVKMALARKDPVQAIAIIAPVVKDSLQFKVGIYLPEALFLKGKAHLLDGEQDPAKSEFEQARLEAEAIGSRRLLWQILSALAGVESDHGKSAGLKAKAREIIQFIADTIHEDAMRSQFLQSKGVGALMA
jgi:hypothetical protein